jgi:1-deoxy-D-xylulose-5-phosphate reductoisomerase
MAEVKSLCILGSTGSIGQNCLRVVSSLRDRFRVVALAAGRNLEVLSQQIIEFRPRVVVVSRAADREPLRDRLRARGYRQRVAIRVGVEGQVEAATHPDVDFVVSACHATTGLVATYEAVRAGKRLALANKEVLVVAGEVVMRTARERGVDILPIDSEHSAVHQCLRAGRPCEVRRLILTGSGGPFLKTPKRRFPHITPGEALKHPVWQMGGRITIDSATLMNKGLELIEAHWLFGLPSAQMDVVIHPESVVHSMIEFEDGSVMAQLGVADMRVPIQYALTYPERLAVSDGSLRLDLATVNRLHFCRPDYRRFPCLELGREALEAGGVAPIALNAADELAVEAFLSHRLQFVDIPRVIEEVMGQAPKAPLRSFNDILEADQEVRLRAAEVLAQRS